jgi:transposase
MPEFITNLVAPLEGKVLFNAQGRGESSLNQAFAVLSPGQKLAVEQVAVDMHDPFMCAIRSNCPNALIVIDRFHLAQKMNQTFDKLRRAEFKKAEQNNKYFEMGILEPKRKFILVSRKKQFLSKVETRLIDDLRRVNKNIHIGMFLVEYFHEALDKKTIKGFRSSLLEWYRVCRTAKLPQFLEFAKLIRKYRKNIEGYINSRLTTAVIEGVNNKIKVLKRMGYGYTNPTSFMRKILQRCGYLNHLSINTDEFYFKWPRPA